MLKISPITILRKKVKITQRQLAESLDVHHSYINNLENNNVDISFNKIAKDIKLNNIFKKLAEWSGEDYNKLVQDQIESNNESLRKVQIQVNNSLRDVFEHFTSKSKTKTKNVKHFLNKLELECKKECKSPTAILRKHGNITQRHLAQAMEVSQAFIARIEKAEISLNGINVGHSVIEYIIKALELKEHESLMFEKLNKIQGNYMIINKGKNKQNVIALFSELNESIDEREVPY